MPSISLFQCATFLQHSSIITFGLEVLAVPRSEVLRVGQHCGVEMGHHSDHSQTAGYDIHPDSSIESLAARSVKIESLGGQNMRIGRGRMAEAGHTKISEKHMGVECHTKVGVGKNFVKSKVVGLGNRLVKSRLGLGMVECWARLGAGVPLNGKGGQTQPLLHPTGTGKP